jgi:uncharacterized membrane protein YqhA
MDSLGQTDSWDQSVLNKKGIFMLRVIFKVHMMALLAIVGSLLGSMLLFLMGAYEVYEAFLLFFGLGHTSVPGAEITEATATILSSLDSFLLGFVLLYFAYNLYFLLTFPEQREDRFGPIKMPPALHVESLDKMKKTILVIIVVSLSVFLLKENMLNVDGYVWTDLFVPLSIVAIAVAIKLIAFDD